MSLEDTPTEREPEKVAGDLRPAGMGPLSSDDDADKVRNAGSKGSLDPAEDSQVVVSKPALVRCRSKRSFESMPETLKLGSSDSVDGAMSHTKEEELCNIMQQISILEGGHGNPNTRRDAVMLMMGSPPRAAASTEKPDSALLKGAIVNTSPWKNNP